ncbi:recombinase family protein [Ruegeria sp.]|uniref:recombinase family protein n=1 Tax=Ruegeria sp. TaxID=1879320 RepID=UPI003C7AAE63
MDDKEAETIRTLFYLYLEHQSILDVKEQAEALELRSRRRERPGGRVTGGKFFDRGHIHHLLSNPIYAGRIRHKGQVFEGQHSAIIDPAVWTHVQQLLTDGAAKERGVKQKATRSALAGKLFDETGDRLTPSHSRKNGKRLRYYISGRLVTDRSQKHSDAWRLPAEQLESLLAEVVRQHLSRSNAATSMTRDMSATEIASATELLRDCQSVRKCLGLIERADLRQGVLAVQLDSRALARTMECRADQVDAEELSIEAPFRMRRRGVELKLHLGDPPPEIDQTLVRNIIKARQWLAMIIDGRTFSEIAEAEGTSKRRVQDVVDLAMLAPDVLEAITAGEQPVGLTTDYLIKSGFPAIWSDQHKQFAAL